MTNVGRGLERVNEYLENERKWSDAARWKVLKPLWIAASRPWARGADVAYCFADNPRPSSIWTKYEKKILRKRGIEVHYKDVK